MKFNLMFKASSISLAGMLMGPIRRKRKEKWRRTKKKAESQESLDLDWDWSFLVANGALLIGHPKVPRCHGDGSPPRSLSLSPEFPSRATSTLAAHGPKPRSVPYTLRSSSPGMSQLSDSSMPVPTTDYIDSHGRRTPRNPDNHVRAGRGSSSTGEVLLKGL